MKKSVFSPSLFIYCVLDIMADSDEINTYSHVKNAIIITTTTVTIVIIIIIITITAVYDGEVLPLTKVSRNEMGAYLCNISAIIHTIYLFTYWAFSLFSVFRFHHIAGIGKHLNGYRKWKW